MDSRGIQFTDSTPGDCEEASVVEIDRTLARAAGEAFAASHAEYPALRAVFPDPRRRGRALRAFFTATVADAITAGIVYAVCDGPVVLGAAVWLPPGGFPWSARRKLAAAPALARVAAAAPARFPMFVRYGAAAERAHPLDRHWYLVALGVRPEARGRGLGTRLLTPTLHRADRERIACYLETSDRANVGFYQRVGFGVVDDALALVPGGPPHLAMRRPVSQQ